VKLTTTAIKTLALPPGTKDKTFWDDELGGFGLRLREGGSRNWVVQYDLGGKSRRVTLGSTSLLDIGTARAKAKGLLAQVRLGAIPPPTSTHAEPEPPKPSERSCRATSLRTRVSGGRRASSRSSAGSRSLLVRFIRYR
jgi:hypothetical protein